MQQHLHGVQCLLIKRGNGAANITSFADLSGEGMTQPAACRVSGHISQVPAVASTNTTPQSNCRSRWQFFVTTVFERYIFVFQNLVAAAVGCYTLGVSQSSEDCSAFQVLICPSELRLPLGFPRQTHPLLRWQRPTSAYLKRKLSYRL